MITAIALTAFFVAIAGALHFSSWAEAWLASSEPINKRVFDVASPARTPLTDARERGTARAA